MRQRLSSVGRVFLLLQNWWVWFAMRLKIAKGEYVIYRLRNGIKFKIPVRSSDALIFNDLWLARVYETPLIDWHKAKTVIDIGGHIGFFALLAASGAPDSMVYAFEPEPDNFRLLQDNIRLNGMEKRIIATQEGVAGTAGHLRLNVLPHQGACHSMFRQTDKSYGIEIPTIRLQDIFERYNIKHCDYMKVNCEGAEYDMYYGLPDEIYKKITAMVINYHFFSPDPRHRPDVLRTHLESKGFRVEKEDGANVFFAVREGSAQHS